MMEWLTDTLLMTGALLALVLLVRRPVTRWFGPGAAYALWALPMIRLVLPPLALPRGLVPEFGLRIEPVTSSAHVPVEAVATQVPAAASVPIPVDLMTTMPAAEPGLLAQVPWLAVFYAVWLGGAALFLAWRIAGYATMRRQLLAGARSLGHSGDVRLVESPAASAPLAFGVFDKVIALPVGFLAAVDSETSDLAIAHELEHHAGSDLLALMAMQPLFALHWFNPLAWAAWRAVRSDQEVACDARVMAGRDRQQRASYGRLIASFAGGIRMALVAPMAGPLSGEKPIIVRLKALGRGEIGFARRLVGRSLFALAIVTVPATATISYAAMDGADTPDSSAPVGEDVTSAAAPAAPQVPSVPAAPGRVASLQAPEVPPAPQSPVAPRWAEGAVAAPMPPMPPVPPAPPAAPDAAGPHPRIIIQKRVVRTGDAARQADEAQRMADEAMARAPMVEESTTPDGKRKVIRIIRHGENGKPVVAKAMVLDAGCPADSRREARSSHDGTSVGVVICTGKPQMTSAVVVGALTSARNSIAADRNLDAKVRSEILADLDREIADAQREAREQQD